MADGQRRTKEYFEDLVDSDDMWALDPIRTAELLCEWTTESLETVIELGRVGEGDVTNLSRPLTDFCNKTRHKRLKDACSTMSAIWQWTPIERELARPTPVYLDGRIDSSQLGKRPTICKGSYHEIGMTIACDCESYIEQKKTAGDLYRYLNFYTRVAYPTVCLDGLVTHVRSEFHELAKRLAEPPADKIPRVKKKPGPPKGKVRTDLARDKRIAEQWTASGLRSFEKFAASMDIDAEEVKSAVERHRKRS